MKIIIDIDKEDYEVLKRFEHKIKDRAEEGLVDKLEMAILNGTPLPKVHGDLIDRKALINNGIQKGFCDWYDEIKYAPTIIEADKGE